MNRKMCNLAQNVPGFEVCARITRQPKHNREREFNLRSDARARTTHDYNNNRA